MQKVKTNFSVSRYAVPPPRPHYPTLNSICKRYYWSDKRDFSNTTQQSAKGNLTRDSHDGRVFPSKTRTIEWPNVFGQEHILKMRNCISLKIFRRCAQSLQSGIFDIRTNASFRVSYSSNLVDASLLDKKGAEIAWWAFAHRYDRGNLFYLGNRLVPWYIFWS